MSDRQSKPITNILTNVLIVSVKYTQCYHQFVIMWLY